MDDRRLDERRESCLKAGFAIMGSFTMVLMWVWEQMKFKTLAWLRERANAFSLTSIDSTLASGYQIRVRVYVVR